MSNPSDAVAPPKDYRLLVPRDWFRIDLTQDRWRGQLKTFVDLQAEGRNVTAEEQQAAWATLRNRAEAGVASGALEYFLRPELADGSLMPASLIVSLIPRSGSLTPRDLLPVFEAKESEHGRTSEVSVVELPGGEAVQILAATTLDLYIHMPGAVGYLVLAFAVPLTGMEGPMHRLCLSIAESLRWIM